MNSLVYVVGSGCRRPSGACPSSVSVKVMHMSMENITPTARTISRLASCNGRRSCLARSRPRLVLGVADIRRHHRPRSSIVVTDIAPYVRSAFDPVRPLPDHPGGSQLRPRGLYWRTYADSDRNSGSRSRLDGRNRHVDGAHGLGTSALAVVMVLSSPTWIGAGHRRPERCRCVGPRSQRR